MKKYEIDFDLLNQFYFFVLCVVKIQLCRC